MKPVNYVQYKEPLFGWTDYEWGDGLAAAKHIYRHVRIVEKHMDSEDTRFFSSKVKVLKLYKDGRRVK